MDGQSYGAAGWENLVYCGDAGGLSDAAIHKSGTDGEEHRCGWNGSYLRSTKCHRGDLLEVRFQERRYWAAYRNGERMGAEWVSREAAQYTLHHRQRGQQRETLSRLTPQQLDSLVRAVEMRKPLGDLARSMGLSKAQAERCARVAGAKALRLCAACKRLMAPVETQGGPRKVCSDACGWAYSPAYQAEIEGRRRTEAKRARGEL